jgi:beta-1,4-N-acetylglucosaminyltransferase
MGTVKRKQLVEGKSKAASTNRTSKARKTSAKSTVSSQKEAKNQDGGKSCFVTVGTTKFDALIQTLDRLETITWLATQGITRLILQIGKGTYEPHVITENELGVAVTWFRFTPSIAALLDEASLVISHAGAGSIVETLRARTPLLVVVNEDLMDNHQHELAGAMAQDGYLYWCTPATFHTVAEQSDWEALKPYPVRDTQSFALAVNDMLCGV